MYYVACSTCLCWYSSAASLFFTSAGISAAAPSLEPPAWEGVVPSWADVDGGCRELDVAAGDDEETGAVMRVGGPLRLMRGRLEFGVIATTAERGGGFCFFWADCRVVAAVAGGIVPAALPPPAG